MKYRCKSKKKKKGNMGQTDEIRVKFICLVSAISAPLFSLFLEANAMHANFAHVTV